MVKVVLDGETVELYYPGPQQWTTGLELNYIFIHRHCPSSHQRSLSSLESQEPCPPTYVLPVFAISSPTI